MRMTTSYVGITNYGVCHLCGKQATPTEPMDRYSEQDPNDWHIRHGYAVCRESWACEARRAQTANKRVRVS